MSQSGGTPRFSEHARHKSGGTSIKASTFFSCRIVGEPSPTVWPRKSISGRSQGAELSTILSLLEDRSVSTKTRGVRPVICVSNMLFFVANN